MEKIMKKTILVITLFLCLTLARAEDTNSVVGVWATDPTLSQLGKIVTHYEFDTNSTFKCWVDFQSFSMPKRVVTGKYRIEQDRVVMISNGKTNTSTIAFQNDILILKERRDVFKLKRKKKKIEQNK